MLGNNNHLRRDFGVIHMAENKAQFLARIGQPVGGAGRALKYSPDHCDLIVTMGKQGSFPEEWANEIGVSLETFRLWARRYPDFREATVMAHQHLMAYWTRELTRSLHNKDARSGLFAMLLRRFPAVYGHNPVDLIQWILEEDKPAERLVCPTCEGIRNLSDAELQARLEGFRRRRRFEETAQSSE